jgi:hypothetical protein
MLLSDARIVAAYAIFAGSYFVFAIGKFPWIKIDRTGARGGDHRPVLMVAFRIVGAQEALQSIDFATIVLLFSMIFEYIQADPSLLAGIPQLARVAAYGGGLPIKVDGVIVGAIGVSGGTVGNDIECAEWWGMRNLS